MKSPSRLCAEFSRLMKCLEFSHKKFEYCENIQMVRSNWPEVFVAGQSTTHTSGRKLFRAEVLSEGSVDKSRPAQGNETTLRPYVPPAITQRFLPSRLARYMAVSAATISVSQSSPCVGYRAAPAAGVDLRLDRSSGDRQHEGLERALNDRSAAFRAGERRLP